MFRLAIPLLALFALLAGCEKSGNKIPEPPPAEAKPVETPKKPAPKGVPQEFVDRVDSAWPAIEKAGNLFVEKFEEARKAVDAGNRDAADAAIKVAGKALKEAQESWSEVYYSAQDYDDKVCEMCWELVRSKERTVKGWTDKAKAMSQFSRAK